MEIVETFKLKLSCSVTHWCLLQECIHFKHSAAFVSNTLLHSFRTHYCVSLEHSTAFNSIWNECSAVTSKRRQTHEDVNAGEYRVCSFRMQQCFFFCFQLLEHPAFVGFRMDSHIYCIWMHKKSHASLSCGTSQFSKCTKHFASKRFESSCEGMNILHILHASLRVIHTCESHSLTSGRYCISSLTYIVFALDSSIFFKMN